MRIGYSRICPYKSVLLWFRRTTPCLPLQLMVNQIMQRIFLRSSMVRRNLLPCKRKNHLGRWFDRRLSQLGNCLTVVTGFRRAQQPNLSFQCSRTLAHTSRATACLAKQILCELPVTSGCCQWRFACFSGLDSSEQLPDKAQQSG